MIEVVPAGWKETGDEEADIGGDRLGGDHPIPAGLEGRVTEARKETAGLDWINDADGWIDWTRGVNHFACGEVNEFVAKLNDTDELTEVGAAIPIPIVFRGGADSSSE